MARFYTRSWFPYILPFLLCFTLAQATIYLPAWHLHISTAKIFIGATLLWMWWRKFTPDLSHSTTHKQLLLAVIFGITGFVAWVASDQFHLLNFPPNDMPTEWPLLLRIVITAILLGGATVVMPIISELFWRSFMLRYLIEQNFQSLPLGQFQLFSFVGVVVLTAIPSQYPVAMAITSVLQNTLLIWQKNLRCCIVSSMVTNSFLAVYLLINHYQLF